MAFDTLIIDNLKYFSSSLYNFIIKLTIKLQAMHIMLKHCRVWFVKKDNFNYCTVYFFKKLILKYKYLQISYEGR